MNKITLYQLVEKWLPEEKVYIKRNTPPMFMGVDNSDNLKISGFNSCLSDLKEKLEKVEVSEDKITEIINNCPSIEFIRGYVDSEDVSIDKLIEDLAQAILTYLENLGKEK